MNPRPRFAETEAEALANTLGTEAGLVLSLNRALSRSPLSFPISTDAAGMPVNRALDALDKLKNCVDLVQFLGIGGESLALMIAEDYEPLARGVAAIVTAIRTKYDTEEAYQQAIGAFEDRIREQRRDALTDYLIPTLDSKLNFQSTNDLYNYFLIDTELGGCARTSRVVAGLSSLQLYIQRCLMNLEQSQDGEIHVLPEAIPAEQWDWRKNYRVWEANRKVFLYPETFIEPDLRDNKTPLFEELESTLLQQEINAQTVLDAYMGYMRGFDEIANLKIAGAYHDLNRGSNILHLFGVTSSESPEYYYRTVENVYATNFEDSRIIWNAWQKVDVQIPVRKVSPIVFEDRLYVFWVEITTRTKNDDVRDGSNVFSGYPSFNFA